MLVTQQAEVQETVFKEVVETAFIKIYFFSDKTTAPFRHALGLWRL